MSFIQRSASLLILAASVAYAGCADQPEAGAGDAQRSVSAASLPAAITAERGGFIPEGIEYDPVGGRLLTGSLAEGTIFELHPDGRLTAAVEDPDLVSTVGIEVDLARDRLLVCNSDSRAFDGSVPGQAKLGAYNLETGERLAMVDLGAVPGSTAGAPGHFANDVAVGPDGTAYVTDTFQNVIYRVSPTYQGSVLYRFPPSDGLGLNGIVFHPSGYLLVTGGARLFKVPVADPAALTEVVLPEAIEGQDGMVWAADGSLAIVSNAQNRVVALTSSDDWATARRAGVAALADQGTTAAVVGQALYVVHPHFADQAPPSVERVTVR